MNHLKDIQGKLKRFIRKYYTNELIKGCILFFTLGLLYFIGTLAVEHFLWLTSDARTVLFWLFIAAELGLLYYYILLPLSKLNGLKKGISEIEASEIIGAHFPEVRDKLINLIQLKNSKENSELISASIAQKSKQLKPITFKKAIDFRSNKRFLKYAIAPLVILLIFEYSSRGSFMLDSVDRLVHYNNNYEPPAPFAFTVSNSSLNVLEGDGIKLKIKTVGDVTPNQARIHLGEESYFLIHEGNSEFSYTIQNVTTSLDFYLSSDNVKSATYLVNCIPTPVITNLKMIVKYPDYTGKLPEVVQNTGNAMVLQGSEVSWQIETSQVSDLQLIANETDTLSFSRNGDDYFSLTRQLMRSLNYKISTSNTFLRNHESLPFTIGVVADRYPKIFVESGIDSLEYGPVEFFGELSDDYGVSRLQLVYYNQQDKERINRLDLTVQTGNSSSFYYIFPDGIEVDEGIEYEFFFEVYDNDEVNGTKKTRSRSFKYYQPTIDEMNSEALKDQKETIESVQKTLEGFKNTEEELNDFEKDIQKKGVLNWDDEQKFEDFVNRQKQYEEMFRKQRDKIEDNLDRIPVSGSEENKKETLKKRIEEAKELAERNELLEQLDSLANRMGRENMLDKLEELSRKNRQNKQSLERLLELTKRFYVEQKMARIGDKLERLSEREDTLSNKRELSKDSIMKEQEKVNEEVELLKDELNELEEENKLLMRPMTTPDHEEQMEDIEKSLEKAMDELKMNEMKNAQKSQKSAARKMKKLAKEFEQQMMQMEGEQLNENIDDLRKIVENLIAYSFGQEDLLERFRSSDQDHPEYPKNLREQQVLKEYFEHIDDSLYMLSLRVASMSMAIQKEVNDVHYYMENALNNFAENRFNQGLSDQQFMITGANNLANMLSDVLENMMNASMSMGKGSGDQEFKLPDIIQKQGELEERIRDGMKEGEENMQKGEGNSGQDSEEEMNGELYEIYKEQVRLRQALEELMKEETQGEGSGDAIDEMKKLEEELLEKGFSNDIIERLQKLQYELLKLDSAKKEQGRDTKRESLSGEQSNLQRAIEKLKLQKKNTTERELLNRQSLPLRSIYLEKVEQYFKNQKGLRQ